MSQYCTISDVYDAGIPRGALPNPGRFVGSVSTTTNLLTLDGHGLTSGQPIQFRAENGSLPAPITEGTQYYALPTTDSAFAVSTVAGGAVLDLTTAGSNVVVIADLPFANWIEWASAMVESFVPAHLVPFDEPCQYPLVVSVTADLAAARGLTYVGGTQIDIQARLANAQKTLDKWGKNQPIRGAVVPKSSMFAVVSDVHGVDPRGWYPYGGGLP